jgi:hypothetical protein
MYLQLRSHCLYYSGGEVGVRNVSYIFLKFLTVKMSPLNVVSHSATALVYPRRYTELTLADFSVTIITTQQEAYHIM